MKRKKSVRWLMLSVGLVTAIVLTVSYSFDGRQLANSKAKTEQSKDGTNQTVLLAQPSDVVVSANQPQLDEITSWVVQWVFLQREDQENATVVPAILQSCFRFLSQSFIISPNAP